MTRILELPARVVVLASGTGSLLGTLIDAAGRPAYPARVVAVGSDRADALALKRAAKAELPTFVVGVSEFPDRPAWDKALTAEVSAHFPDLVVMAGFMRLAGPAFLAEFAGRALNTHPALLPAFPGPHAVRDALAHGVKVTGASVILIDAGVDTGPIVAQVPVEVLPGDDEETLHERIKAVERVLLVETVRMMVTEGWTVSGRRVSIP
jgi:formyltetrahydrofolate-dependent phosphoribosylglycinamide formyltransferase